MSNGAKRTEPGVDDLQAQIETLKSDIKELTTLIGSVGKAEARRAVTNAKAQGEAVREKGEEQLDHLRTTAEGYGREAGVFVREQPGTALGIAAGVGFLIGFIMSGRR